MQKVGANIANKDVSYVKCILLCEKKRARWKEL